MKKITFETPDFLICETPIKNNNFNDLRLWIYCPAALSLIEFIKLDDLLDFKFKDDDYFVFNNEAWTAQFTQNNCEITGVNETQLKQQIIEVFKKHYNSK